MSRMQISMSLPTGACLHVRANEIQIYTRENGALLLQCAGSIRTKMIHEPMDSGGGWLASGSEADFCWAAGQWESYSTYVIRK